MKTTAVLSLCLAPLVLAKAVHNVYPGRRSQHLAARDGHNTNSNSREKGGSVVAAGVGANSVTGLSPAELALLGLSGVGISKTSVSEVVIIWINSGGGAATTVVNAPVTTTVTVQAGGDAAAAATTASSSSSSAAGGEAAASTTVAGAATSVAAGTGATHTVTVGGPAAGLQFVPSEIQAAIGDMVIFTFLSNNHTATQSAFATPCDPLAGGMDSGFQPNPNNTVNPPPQVAMQVMVDTPLWFYCKQAGHCGKGMTFSINPTAAKTQAMFQAMAIAQNGTGSSTTITGGSAGGAAAAAGSSSSSSSSAAADVAGTSTAVAVATGATTATAVTGVATGTGQTNADGSCSCAVICSAGAFPAVAQGAGAFGGFGGSIPAVMVGAA